MIDDLGFWQYGCAGSLRLSLDFLFSGKPTDLETTSKAVVASYLLDHPVLFKKFTKSMVHDFTSSFTALATSDLGRMIPTLVWREFILKYARLFE